MDTTTETFEHAGHTVKIGLETETGIGDPRDADNPSLLYCWHPNYVLGDEQFSRDDFESMEAVETYLREERGAVGPILPLYLYDHSGISISAGSNAVGRGDTAIPGGGSDSWGNPRGWDSTMVGFICAPEERIAVCCGDGAEYRTDEWIEKMLRQEVATYNAYLTGSVYYYVVENDEGEYVGGCGGFLVVEEADLEELRSEARAEAEGEAHDVAVNEEPDVERVIFEATR